MLCLTLCVAPPQITHVVPTQSKEVDDVLGGDEAWRNVDSTAGTIAGADTPALLP